MPDAFIPNEWRELLFDITGSHLKVTITSFLCEYPNMRFTGGVLPCTEDYRVADVMECLKELVEEGIVDTCCQNGVILYGLTAEEPWRSLIVTLSGFDPYQRRNLLHNLWEPSRQKQDNSGEQVICG